MADPYYGPGGTGYYTDPSTGKRYYQVRYQQGPDAYDPNANPQDSRLTYDPNGGATYGPGATNAQTGSGGTTTGNGTTTTNPTAPANTGTAPTTTAGVDPSSDTSQSAKALLTGTLATYGLSSLADKVWQQYLDGIPIEQIMLDLRQTPEYKARFPGMAELSAKGRAISEAEYISNEQAYVQRLHMAGFPDGMYDTREQMGKWIGSETSPDEIGARLDEYVRIAYQSPPETRAELERLYGVGIGGVAALMLDETKALPLLHNEFLAAQASGSAVRAGYGALTLREAEQLGASQLSQQQTDAGFGQLVNAAQLFTPLVGDQGENAISRADQLAGTFGGNAAAQQRIQQRAQKRRAAYSDGGGYIAGKGFGTGEGS